MHLLLMTAYFPPDTGSAAHLFHDLGRSLAKLGHRVSVVTGFPGYHAQGDLGRYTGRSMVETMDGLEIHRTRVPEFARQTPVGRGLWQLACRRAFSRAALELADAGPLDATLVYSPPLPIGQAALDLRRRRGVPCIVNIQDLFPRSAMDLGVLRNGLLIRWFERLETKIYRESDRITVHSEGNRDHVLAHGGSAGRTLVMPNSVDTDEIRPGARMNSLRADLGIPEEAFVASFGGIMGFSQDLDTILDAANRLKDRPRFRFVLAGEGVEKQRCMDKGAALGLASVHWLPMIPRERYPALLAASDVCLTTLRADVKTPVVPSKILSAMAAGRAVVACLDPAGDAPKLIAEAACGLTLPPEDGAALSGTLEALEREPARLSAMGGNGRRFAEEHLSPMGVARAYEALFRAVRP